MQCSESAEQMEHDEEKEHVDMVGVYGDLARVWDVGARTVAVLPTHNHVFLKSSSSRCQWRPSGLKEKPSATDKSSPSKSQCVFSLFFFMRPSQTTL